MKNKKEKILIISLVLILILMVGAVSYATFRFSGLGSKVNSITTGSVTMSYTESSNVLSMSGALPTTDATGKVRLNPGEYFDFTVSSSITGDTNINYEIAVEELSGNTISGDYIKFYLTKVNTDGTEEEVMAPSTYSADLNANTYTGRPANMMSLYTSSMDSSETTTYRLRMYVGEEYNPQGDGGNLTYKARVNVYGLAGDKIENEPLALAAGLYDENDVMIASWDELVNDYGLDIEADGINGAPASSPSQPACLAYKILGNENLINGSKIVIPKNVTRIGIGQFSESNIEEVIISNGVTTIGNNAFQKCLYLTSIDIPDSVTSIGSSAFSGCTGLTSIDIPDGVTSIGSSAFKDCTGLTSIDIPDSVTSILSTTFMGCTSLTSITIPDNVTFISNMVFYGSALAEINYLGTKEQWNNVELSTGDGASYCWNYGTSELIVHCTDGDIVIPAYSA